MARNDSPDNEFDPEMEGILREHFQSEASDLRSPSDPWVWLESHMEEPVPPSFFSRLLGSLKPLGQFRLSPAFAGAGVAVIAVAIAATVWVVSSNGGPETSGGLAAVAPTEAPAATVLRTDPTAAAAESLAMEQDSSIPQQADPSPAAGWSGGGADGRRLSGGPGAQSGRRDGSGAIAGPRAYSIPRCRATCVDDALADSRATANGGSSNANGGRGGYGGRCFRLATIGGRNAGPLRHTGDGTAGYDGARYGSDTRTRRTRWLCWAGGVGWTRGRRNRAACATAADHDRWWRDTAGDHLQGIPTATLCVRVGRERIDFQPRHRQDVVPAGLELGASRLCRGPGFGPRGRMAQRL